MGRTVYEHLPLIERILSQAARDPESDCWVWFGNTTSHGYPRLVVKRKEIRPTRVMHEHFNGPIPEGWHVDHVVARGCTTTLCINPAHLEAVPIGENIRRGRTGAAARLRWRKYREEKQRRAAEATLHRGGRLPVEVRLDRVQRRCANSDEASDSQTLGGTEVRSSEDPGNHDGGGGKTGLDGRAHDRRIEDGAEQERSPDERVDDGSSIGERVTSRIPWTGYGPTAGG
jgi:HNH endonuclease